MKFSSEKKRIGINLLFINPKLLGGSFVYAKNLIEEISNIDKTNDYYIYINKESKKLKFNIGSNFKIRVLNFNYSSVYLRYFWEQFILPFYLFKDKIDLIHSPGYVTPILSTVKKVVSILDINYKGHSNNMKFTKRILLGIMVNLSARVSNSIITISEFSKKQIIKHTNSKAHKINVTLLSGSSDLNISNNITEELIKSKYRINSDYIICFGGSSPHKNILKLIKSIKNILINKSNLKLVIVGYVNNEIYDNIKKLKLEDCVITTGFIPDEDVNPLISYAKVFIFPSLYEGFGIPLLDAQSCGVPVVSSNAGSLTEVGGSETYYFDPKSKIDIYNTVSKVINLLDDKKVDDLINFGFSNRSKFSWRKTAKETLDIYKNILN